MTIKSFSVSDVGLKRSTNEDSYCSDDITGLYVVADGMGGHAYGEVASRMAVETIESFVQLTASSAIDDGQINWPYDRDQALTLNANRLVVSIRYANQKLIEHAENVTDCEGMGTTVVGVLVERNIATVAHVGDSRLYLIRDGEITCITKDHSWVNEQVMLGLIDSEQARNHPLRNVVTKALGGKKDLEVDFQEMQLIEGDRLLLCSDGLTTMLHDNEILNIVLANGGTVQQANALVDAANQNGGEDNCTTILLHVC